MRPRRRLRGALATWLLVYLACPGVVARDGSALLAALAFVPWGLACARPGPRAFLVEYFAAALGLAGTIWFVWYVFPLGLVPIGVALGLYPALGGVLLRRLAARLPLSLAVPLAFTAAEALRCALPTPPSLAWWRVGYSLVDVPWLAGSARVWGVGGLTLVLAGLGGAVAEWLGTRSVRRALPGLAPAALAAALAALTSPGEFTDGPSVLLVQPGFPQEVKSDPTADPLELFRDARALTREELTRCWEAGELPPDLVCWGETMLVVPLYEPQLRERIDSVEWNEWDGPLSAKTLDLWDEYERAYIGCGMLGRDCRRDGEGVLPGGTSFLSGAVVSDVLDGRHARRNAVVLWGPDGVRQPAVGKSRMVPGAETLWGWERHQVVRDFVWKTASYIPDLVPYEGAGVLALTGRDGRVHRFTGTACFDNAHPGVYGEAQDREDPDFHLVVSNEAWYRESCEMDQMIAFSRLVAIATGRAFVRATNSGITAVIGPDGAELARLEVGGRDRLVAGSLRVVVPVPAPGARRSSFWPRSRRFWPLAWVLLGGAGLLLRRSRAER